MFVKNGGRVVVFEQNPEWMKSNYGFRIAQHLSRYVFPVSADHPVVNGLDEQDLRNWSGVSSLVEEYPDYLNQEVKKGEYGVPYYGWHWGNRGAVTSAAIEKPHHSGWRPILECEFDLAYSPLMELDYGKGRFILCILDLEDHFKQEPVVPKLLTQMLDYAQTGKLNPRSNKVLYVGDKAGKEMLDSLGLIFQAAIKTEKDADLLIVCNNARINDSELKDYLTKGGKVLFLATKSNSAPLGIKLFKNESFGGSLNVPQWSETAGLSASDLRWRTFYNAWLLKSGCDIGADGMLGKLKLGKGTAIFCQLDPNQFDTEKNSYFRYTRWRQTRALTQILANMGCVFQADSKIFNYCNDEISPISLEGTWKAQLTKKLNAVLGVHMANEDPGMTEEAKKLMAEIVDESNLQTIKLPMHMEMLGGEWSNADGEAIFRTSINIPESWSGNDLLLDLGIIGDFDNTFFNGIEIGKVDKSTPEYWTKSRIYKIPRQLVKSGRNSLAVRVFDCQGNGGIIGGTNKLFIRPIPKNSTTECSFYHSDYRTDFKLGDDPYRYFRW
jgi:beta-galactosidase